MGTEDKNIEELSMDLYANFGLAYFSSECLHRELCNFYMSISKMNSPGMTRPRLEELYISAESMTLGRIIEELKSQVEPDLSRELEKAISIRNYLAHHFWFKTAPLLFKKEGIIQAIEELRAHRNYFQKIDEDVSKMVREMSRSFGVTDQILEDSLKELISGKSEEIKKPLRKLKTIEKIICVYDVFIPNKGDTFVFESDDGMLWQLCDVGLGWSNYEEKENNWKSNSQLATYLPFSIISRPKNYDKWEYQFEIGKNAIFWVKKTDSGIFKWGIQLQKTAG